MHNELEYPKIETLYNRKGKWVDINVIRKREFFIPKEWTLTEKINGRNLRASLFDNGEVEIEGRHDDSEIPSELYHLMEHWFTPEKMQKCFWMDPEKIPRTATVYGEGYGAGMVPGSGIYRNNASFRMFDCLVETWWLDRANIEDVAKKLNIKVVPIIGQISTFPKSASDLKNLFQPFGSYVAKQETSFDEDDRYYQPEGIVAKTDPIIFNKKGERIMWKLKLLDFKPWK